MKPSLHSLKLCVRKSAIHGYGVFADQAIAANDVIEECCALLSDLSTHAYVDYYFAANGKNAIALGNGSLYNHSDNPNAHYIWDEENHILTFYAAKPITKGEEILISYGHKYFTSRNMAVKQASFWFKWRQCHSLLMMLARFALVSGVLYSCLVWLN